MTIEAGNVKRWMGVRSLLVVYVVLTAYISLTPWVGIHHGPWTTPLLTVLGFGLAVSHAGLSLGRVRMGLLLGLSIVISLVFETVGVVTGWVYGPYHYTDMLGPRFLGLVPYLIPIAWFMMIYPSQVISERLLEGRRLGGWRRALGLAAVASVVMTSWDLLMDPMMVQMGAWVWDVPGAYFGIPVHNYAGWIATTFVIYAIYRWIEPRLPRVSNGGNRMARLAVWAFLVTWLGNTSAALQFGLVGPALVGTFSAGVLGMLAILPDPT